MKPNARERFESKTLGEPNSGCLLWMAGCDERTGYGRFASSHSQEQFAHRWAWIFAHGEIPAGMHVLHKCDVRSCVNPSHLFLGTPLDNIRDCIAKGRRAQGEKNPQTKLTIAVVRAIRQDSRHQSEIASSYGISQQSVSDLKRKVRWGHVS